MRHRLGGHGRRQAGGVRGLRPGPGDRARADLQAALGFLLLLPSAPLRRALGGDNLGASRRLQEGPGESKNVWHVLFCKFIQ